MVTIIFPDRNTEKRALAFLLGRFSGRVMRSGEHLVPEAALEALADQNISFTVKGKATYEQQVATIRGLLPPLFNDGREVTRRPPSWPTLDRALASRNLYNEIICISMGGPRVSRICTAGPGPRTGSPAAPRRPRARDSRPEHGLT